MLWLLGVEVLPSLHLGTHDSAHTHEVDGTIVSHQDAAEAELERLHQLAHEQSGRPCLHPKPAKPKRDQLAFDRLPTGHTAAGIAHHATALHQPAPPLTAPVAAPHAETWRFEAPNARGSITYAARPSARGPPLA